VPSKVEETVDDGIPPELQSPFAADLFFLTLTFARATVSDRSTDSKLTPNG